MSTAHDKKALTLMRNYASGMKRDTLDRALAAFDRIAALERQLAEVTAERDALPPSEPRRVVAWWFSTGALAVDVASQRVIVSRDEAQAMRDAIGLMLQADAMDCICPKCGCLGRAGNELCPSCAASIGVPVLKNIQASEPIPLPEWVGAVCDRADLPDE